MFTDFWWVPEASFVPSHDGFYLIDEDGEFLLELDGYELDPDQYFDD